MEKVHDKNIEKRLAQVFQRVTPSRTFVNTVRERFQDATPQVVVEKFSQRRKATLLTLGGVLSVSLLILTIARVVYYLLGRSKQTV